ncbi:MAG: hypothetical protein JO093_14435 [Acidobacteria bacterium]|nr:hypothetical protein [Acidobacteriota bacterium]MBV9068348.1 hypothetical protein [Acidobacteriota bacterium]MBV9186815.1 hypothetical protein [Acidobacteriota bacterium]
MSEIAMNEAVRPRRGWVITAWVGVVMVLIAMLVVAAVIIDKPHFGWMVKSLFLEFISAGVMIGGLLVLLAGFFLPERKTWRGITLMLWGLIALTSPGFGLMFLLPWGLVAAALPLVIAILIRQSRISRA